LQPARPLAPVETGGAAQTQATVAAHFAQARTLLDRPPEAPQLHLPTTHVDEPTGPQGGVGGPQGAGAAPRGPGAAGPSRAAAIAGIEAGAAAQMQSQAPGQLAQGHAALTGQLRGHIDQAEQFNTQAVTDAAAQANTGTQAAQQTLTTTTTAAQATAQADATQCRAQ